MSTKIAEEAQTFTIEELENMITKAKLALEEKKKTAIQVAQVSQVTPETKAIQEPKEVKIQPTYSYEKMIGAYNTSPPSEVNPEFLKQLDLLEQKYKQEYPTNYQITYDNVRQFNPKWKLNEDVLNLYKIVINKNDKFKVLEMLTNKFDPSDSYTTNTCKTNAILQYVSLNAKYDLIPILLKNFQVTKNLFNISSTYVKTETSVENTTLIGRIQVTKDITEHLKSQLDCFYELPKVTKDQVKEIKQKIESASKQLNILVDYCADASNL
jgi:hypothetical protein